MELVADQDKRNKIADAAQSALDRHQPQRYRISVDPDAILAQDNWFHIIVTTPGDVRDREFYEAVAEAEAELQDEKGHQYLLVPAIGD